MGTDIASDRRALPRLRHTPIGRDHDIDAVVDLTAAAPVVTLTGPGGIGKTTLALAVAHRLRDRAGDDLPDGVIFADLSPLAPGAGIAPLVADVAYVEGADGKTAAGLAPLLAQRAALLVLDNCEHVLASASDLVDRILEAGDGLRILATSRELLRVPGEHVWPLGTLGEAAPALFVERARAAEPRVAWRADDPSVVELCRRVDGVPLAVELAAGQLRRFDLPELLRRLDDRLEPLASRPSAGAPWGASDDAARHATMDAAIDWSYRLLERTEQALLRHLSVFPAEFPLDAVEASAPPLGAEAPLAVFGQLVDKSLVVRRPGSGRYRLLETIRVFARDRLEESGEAAAALERHRRHQLDKVTAASRLDRWMSARLAAAYCTDAHDERQAFQLSLAAGAVGDAVEIGLGGAWLWRNARGSTEGQVLLDALDRLGVELSPRDRLWTSLLQADVSQGLGHHHRLFDAAAAAWAVAPAADDPDGACIAAHFVALGHFAEPDRAREHLDVALGFAHDSGDERLVTLNEAFLTVLDVTAGRYDEARAAMARLDRAASEDGYDRFITHWTGWMLGLAERDVAARRWMQRQQDYLDRTGIVETWITSFSTAMCDVVEGGDVLGTLARTLLLADREGYSAAPDCVLVLAYAEICAGRFEAAAELVGTAMHARFNATAHTVLYRAVLAPALARHLDADTLAAAIHRGRARTPGSALAAHGLNPV